MALSNKERQTLFDHGYLPEHVVEYVQSVSLSEPFIHESFLLFFRSGHMIFIGYPLACDHISPSSAYESAIKRFDPATVSIMAPELWINRDSEQAFDNYYIMKLPLSEMDGDNAYMVRRAARELEVREAKIGGEHKKLISAFVSDLNFTEGQRSIYHSIPAYMKRCPTARLIEARKRGELAAFNILDLGTANYGMYMFNIRSFKIKAPGASDLLLAKIAEISANQGKKALNLGLGINQGITRFKEKWGGRPVWGHISTTVKLREIDLMSLLKKGR